MQRALTEHAFYEGVMRSQRILIDDGVVKIWGIVMKQYYKQGGFFDRLDRFSRWIDCMLELYGIMYFIPGFREISIHKSWLHEMEIELKEAIGDVAEAKEDYNKSKYWWMKEL